MTDEQSASAPDTELPRPVVAKRRDWMPSLIWLIPVVAALVGFWLVAKILLNRGPEIDITFLSAEGLEAGKTAVKYKEVQIGTVQTIRLARDRSHVNVTVQLKKEADSFTAKDTRYWVVRPRLDTSGISGLGTLLSGAYIGADAGSAEETASEFKGLEVPPIITRDAPGRQFTLHARDAGSVDIGSPVFFRRIKVGQVASYQLDPDGRGVTLRVFINTPYDQYVGVNTRFWHASGIDVQLSASGLTLRTQALATIVLGGIAFQAPDDNLGELAGEGAAFALANDEASAMREPDGESRHMLMYFNQSLRGLTPGAPVDFRGIVIGEVKSIGVEFDRNEREFRMPVFVEIYPERLRRRAYETTNQGNWTPDQRFRFLIGKGLRAQLRMGNLLTGQVYVALDFFPKAPAVKVDVERNPIELPTMPNSLDDLQAQIQDIASKLNKVPIEQIGNDARTALVSLDKTLKSVEVLAAQLNKDVTPEMTAAMKDVRKTLNSADRTLANDSPLQQDLRQTLQELTRSAASLRTLTDYLERHPESLLRGKPEDKK
ncbi:MlaD family protein [Variovorax sp. J22R133]|uniref:PqiB family protein n=1 Tax=Variovorax brevis TaxID=3053503 RepID=UPI0025763512|nr:MlaD family protein [Variovorax sp. J22R133]MDM0111037.1 MlaD family protein [Variovorax sp. J22R133]